MKRKELSPIREKTREAIEKAVQEKRLELAKVQAELRLGRVKNVKVAKNLRRDIAQLMTILREKKIIEKNE